MNENCLSEKQYDYLINDMGFLESIIDRHLKNMDNIEFKKFSDNINNLIKKDNKIYNMKRLFNTS